MPEQKQIDFSRLLTCALGALGLLFFNPAYAQGFANRTALLIGISQYQSADTPALSGVPHDLVSAQKIALAMGVPAANIRVLKDQLATKANILNALRELGDQTGEGSRTFLYFSGHGTRWKAPNEGACVEGLLTYDGLRLVNREIAEVTSGLSQKADKVIAMYDACHSQGVAPSRGLTSGVSELILTPKFFTKADGGDEDTCAQPSNVRTRGLVETSRLNALQENVIQITSSRPDEVSFDEPGKGGLATQGIRDCLLGDAKDLDESGAVSLAEIQTCAQASIDLKLKNSRLSKPHHITVSGTRNLIPVATQRPLAAAPIERLTASESTTTVPTAIAALASLATLKDIEAQRNPKRKVEVVVPQQMRIGKDALSLKITSSHDGYVYLVLLGSDAKSFYVLFPNGLDNSNRIKAKQALTLPKPDWQIKAAGPAGIDHLLVMVSDSPRRLDELTLAPPSAAEPFTYALTTLQGRAALVNYLTGSGVNGVSESFGAQLVSIKEVP